MSQEAWDRGYSDNWQQGSGILVTSPEVSDNTRILGNHIENAAQGIDLHCDHVVVANNVVLNSFMGIKAMHGSRNILIIGNQFTKNSLWAIGLMPGAAAHATNTDGGSIIANNIISDFGHGNARWIWGDDRSPFRFSTGQNPTIHRSGMLSCKATWSRTSATRVTVSPSLSKGARTHRAVFISPTTSFQRDRREWRTLN